MNKPNKISENISYAHNKRTTTQTISQELVDNLFINKKNKRKEIINIYKNSKNKYHNRTHIENCINELEEIKDQAENLEAIKMAILFHDIIYIPSSNENEEKSAKFAVNYLTGKGRSTKFIEKVKKLILITKHNKTPKTNDEKLIIDIDLSILGKNKETYNKYANNVKQEYLEGFSGLTEEKYKEGRKSFLKKFLEKENIYHTKKFYEKYEKQARENLENELKAE